MNKNKYQNKCLYCQREWNSSHPGQFCPRSSCFRAYHWRKTREESGTLNRVCGVCNTPFKAKRAQTEYCSTACNNHDWFKNNPEKHNFKEAKRRAAKLNATPKWLTEEHWTQIKLIYKTCPEGYHVDHIIPLQGEEVRGLHVPWNLQHLTAKENIVKSNKVEL